MRRYRFGLLAVLVAGAYFAAVVVLGVVALVTGEEDFLWYAVARGWNMDLSAYWWLVLALVLVGAVQSWVYWQVLRGRVRGEPASRDRRVTLLRTFMYVNVALALIPFAPLYLWLDSAAEWLLVADALVQVPIVWLFFTVLAGAVPTWVRILMLIIGTLSTITGIGLTLSESLRLDAASRFFGLISMDGLPYTAWVALLLVAQARDPRWSRGTVWVGVLSLITSFIQPTSFVSFSYGVPYELLAFWLLSVLGVLGVAWQARSAHELAGLPAGSRRAPLRTPSRRWPLPALAIAIPLVPAAVNLANGMPFWIGPRGKIERLIVGGVVSEQAALAWLALDLLVGVGVPALLILATVLRGTVRLMRITVSSLVLLAAVGAAGAVTTAPDPEGGDLPLYPDGLFVKGQELTFGISPLWYSAALLTSAALLVLLYAAPPARRRPHYVLVAALALCFVPIADHSRGTITTAADCRAPEDLLERQKPHPQTAEQAYVCGIRQRGGLLKFADTTPDQVLLTHGRRLCGIYTRDDPREVARLRAQEGLDRQALSYTLASICPSAAATLKVGQDEEEQEMAKWMADSRRLCDATPRHRPLIRPATRTVIKEPQFTDYGVMETWEDTGDNEPYDDDLLTKAQDNGLVAVGPGHLMVLSDSDFDLCVTVETYTRRPPVETKGWDHVVEVGYESTGGQIGLADPMGGDPLPNLALDGRKGHYRVRVHYAWFPWDGLHEGGQRLLIMAYPGRGDKLVTYRNRTR